MCAVVARRGGVADEGGACDGGGVLAQIGGHDVGDQDVAEALAGPRAGVHGVGEFLVMFAAAPHAFVGAVLIQGLTS